MINSPESILTKKQKLHLNLLKKGLYTKEYEEFSKQFADPEKQKALYEELKGRELVTTEFDTFQFRYFPEAIPKAPVDPETRKGIPFEVMGEYIDPADAPSRNPIVNFGKTYWNVSTKQLPSMLRSAAAATDFNIADSYADNRFLRSRESTSQALDDLIEAGDYNVEQGRIRNLQAALEGMEEFQQAQEGMVISVRDIDDTIDAANWVANSIGQAAAQIPASILTGGMTSLGQEIGIIYLDQVKKIAERENISPEEVIEQGLDDRASAVAYGSLAGALDYLGARTVTKLIPVERVKKDLARRGLSMLRGASTEFATESSQSIIEQFGAATGSGSSYYEALTGVDLKEAADEGAAGAVGGGAINIATEIQQKILEKGREVSGRNRIEPRTPIEKIEDPDLPDVPDAGDIETPQPIEGGQPTATDEDVLPPDIPDEGGTAPPVQPPTPPPTDEGGAGTTPTPPVEDVDIQIEEGSPYYDPFYTAAGGQRVYRTDTNEEIDVQPTQRNIDILARGRQEGAERLETAELKQTPEGWRLVWDGGAAQGQMKLPYDPKTEERARAYYDIMRIGAGLDPIQQQPAGTQEDTPTPPVEPPAQPDVEFIEAQKVLSIPEESLDAYTRSMTDEERVRFAAPDYLRTPEGEPVQTGQPIQVTAYRGVGREDQGSIYGEGAAGAILGDANYYALNESEAAEFGDTVEEQQVQLRNPLVIRSDRDLARWMMGDENAQIPTENEARSQQIESFRNRIEEAGYDGVIVEVPKLFDLNENDELVKRLREVFDRSQIIAFNQPEAQLSGVYETVDEALPRYQERFPYTPDEVIRPAIERRLELDRIFEQVNTEGVPAHKVKSIPLWHKIYGWEGLYPSQGTLNRIDKNLKAIDKGYKRAKPERTAKEIQEFLDEIAQPYEITQEEIAEANRLAEQFRQEQRQLETEIEENKKRWDFENRQKEPIRQMLDEDQELIELIQSIPGQEGITYGSHHSFVDGMYHEKFNMDNLKDALRSTVLLSKYSDQVLEEVESISSLHDIAIIAEKGVESLAEMMAKAGKPIYRNILDNYIFDLYEADLINDYAYSRIVSNYDVKDLREVPASIEDSEYDPEKSMYPPVEDTVRIDGQVTEELTPIQAQERINEWKAAAKDIRRKYDDRNKNKVVLSIYDRTGVWSKPYAEAGYNVLNIDAATGGDIFEPGSDPLNILQIVEEKGWDIVGILTAPPCTSFSASGARWWANQHDLYNPDKVEELYGRYAAKITDTPLDAAIMLASINEVLWSWAKENGHSMKFFALENPVGRIARKAGLPKPRLSFHPNNFGDPYTKKTMLWGEFNTDLPTANVQPTKGSISEFTSGSSESGKKARSVTPEGFAYAFFMANTGLDPDQEIEETRMSNKEIRGRLEKLSTMAEQRLEAEGTEIDDGATPFDYLTDKEKREYHQLRDEIRSYGEDALGEYQEFFDRLTKKYTVKPIEDKDLDEGAVEPDTETVLKQNDLTVEMRVSQKGNDFWVVGGKGTYGNRELIKSIAESHEQKPIYSKKFKGWLFFNQDPTPDLAQKLAGLEGGTEAGDGDTRTGTEDRGQGDQLTTRREEEQSRPDQSRLDKSISELVSGNTRELIARGLQFGVPQKIIDQQFEDVARIVNAYEQGKEAFVLGNAAGSGKTFVLGGAIREATSRGAERILYVTMNQDLISQIEADLGDYGIGNVEFMTYAKLRNTDDSEYDMIIFDEAHNIKNIQTSQQAIRAQGFIDKAGFTVFSSATPFENPVEAGYLKATGVFDKAGGFIEWVKIFGAHTKKIRDGNGNIINEIPYWPGNVDPELGKAAREWFWKQGIMQQREMQIPPDMTDVTFRRIESDPQYIDMYENAIGALEDRLSLIDKDWDMPLYMQMAGYITNLKKRILESSKIQAGIERAEYHINQGRSAVIFVETKAARSMDVKQIIEDDGEYQQMKSGGMDVEPPHSKVVVNVASALLDAGYESFYIPSTEEVIQKHFGKENVAIYTGSQTNAQANRNLADWRAKKKQVLVATMAKGGTGLSLHDTNGDRPTAQININLPWKATGVDQVAGRVTRYGIASTAYVEWLFSDGIAFDRALAKRVAERMADMGAIVKGEVPTQADFLEDFDFDDVQSIDKKEQVPVNPPTPPAEPPTQPDEDVEQPAGGQSATQFMNMRLSAINTDVDRFQNRENEYSEETVTSIVEDVNAGRLDPRDIPPILVWTDPNDGNTYVVGGHSRVEAFRRLGLDIIQTQDISHLSEEQAIRRGREDNALGTQESFVEQAKLVRDWMADEEISQAEIERRAKQLFKRNNKVVIAFAALNPRGKAIQSVAQFEGVQTGERERIQNMAKYVGEARLAYPQLTDSHETELFNYLLDNDNKRTKSQRAFLEFVGDLVKRKTFMGEFDDTQPLNIKQIRPKTELEEQANEELKNAEKDLKAAQNALQSKIEEIEKRREDGEDISDGRAREVLKKYQDHVTAVGRKVLQARQRLQRTEDRAGGQSNLFSGTPGSNDALFAVDLPKIRRERDEQGKQTPTMSRQEIVDFVINKLGTAVGVGKSGKLRRAFGFYRSGGQGNIIRLGAANDIMTLAHEVGHRLHHLLFQNKTHPEFDSELLPLGRPTSRPSYTTDQVRKEGQAEFFRHLMLNPALAERKAPNYYEAFAARLEEYPEVQYAVDELYSMYKTYYNQNPVQRFESQIAFDDDSPTKRAPQEESPAQYLYRKIYDNLIPLDRMRKDLDPESGADPVLFSRDAFRLAQMNKGLDGVLQGWIEYGVRDPDGNLQSKGLNDIFMDNGINTNQKRKQFNVFLHAQRALELYEQADAGKRELVDTLDDRGGALGVTREEAQAVVNEYGSEAFYQAAEELYAWNDAVLDWVVERRYMSKKQVDSVRQLNRRYVPMHRVMDYLDEKSMGNPSAALVDQPALWHKLRGSGRRMKPAVETLILNVKSMINRVENNYAALQAFEMISKSEDGGVWADQVIKPIKPVQSDLESIKKTLIDAGIDEQVLEVMDLEEVFTLWRPRRHNPAQGEVMIRKDGETYIWQVHNDTLYEALTQYSPPITNFLARFLALGRNVFRHGVIMSLDFITGNTARDQFVGHINSRYGYAFVHLNPFKKGFGSSDFLRGVASIIRRDENYQLWLQSKAGISGIIDQSRDTVGKTVQQLGETRPQRFIKNVLYPTRWLQGIETFASIFENSTRVGEFIRGLEVEGRSEEGLARAAISSREISGDFARGGDWAKAVGRYKAFFNAGLQGDLVLFQAMKRDPLGFMLRGVISMTLTTLALNYLLKDNPDWQEREEERQMYWLFPLGNPSTTTRWFRLRKPWTIGSFFGQVLPDAVETAVTREIPENMDYLIPSKNVAARILMDLTPNVFLPLIEVSAGDPGYIYFWDKSIDPYFDTELEPYLRYGGTNTELEKMMGKAFNYSPRKIRHLIRGYTGTLGIELNELTSEFILENLEGLDRPPAPQEGLGNKPGLKPFFSPDLNANAAKSVQDFYKHLNEARTALRSFNVIASSDPEEAAMYLEEHQNEIGKARAMQKFAEQFSIIRDNISRVYESRDMTPKEKREALQVHNNDLIQLAKSANEVWEPISIE